MSNLIVFVFVGVLYVTVVQGIPQGGRIDTVSEVFSQCSDLEQEGYEGYSCVPSTTCQDGYIVSDVLSERISVLQAISGVDNDTPDVSNYLCPDPHDTFIRQDSYDDYYYDYESTGDSNSEMICCRDGNFFGKGK